VSNKDVVRNVKLSPFNNKTSGNAGKLS